MMKNSLNKPTGSQLPSWWTRQHSGRKGAAPLLNTFDLHLLHASRQLSEANK